jgi:hypothetical protein
VEKRGSLQKPGAFLFISNYLTLPLVDRSVGVSQLRFLQSVANGFREMIFASDIYVLTSFLSTFDSYIHKISIMHPCFP